MIVYTCITNSKDNIVNVQRQEGVKFVCFTDNPRLKHPVWEFRPIDALGQSDPRRIARRYKILSHIYFPEQTTIWVDGRVRLLKPVMHYVDKYKGLVCARRHHARSCIYEEAREIKRINYDDPVIVDAHVSRLRDLGYPANNGLHETGVVIRRPFEVVNQFNEMIWAMISTGSKRDQLSFNYVARWCDIDITDIDRSEVQVLRHKRATNAQT